MMLNQTLKSIAVLSAVVFAHDASAIDWKFITAAGDVLEIRASEVGSERFDIEYEDATRRTIMLTHRHNGKVDTDFISAGLVRRLVFIGDDDRDEVYNWTDKGIDADGAGGSDILQGSDFEDASDILKGGTGMDILLGRDGNDTLIPGPDLLEIYADGGDGRDTIIRTPVLVVVPARYLLFHQLFLDQEAGEPTGCETQQWARDWEPPIINMNIVKDLRAMVGL